MGLALACAGLGCDDGDGGGADVEMSEGPGADGGVTTDSPETIASNLDVTGYGEALEFVAQIRPPGSAHWQAVQDRCATVFADAGFTVERHDYGTGVNVVGVLPGVSTPNELVVVSAHYDHIPGCVGADDNASGTAGVLEAARALGGRTYARTLVVACWDEEEWGLIGSRAWTARTKRQGHTVTASVVFETMGFSTDRPGAQRMPDGFEFLFPELAAFVDARDGRGDFIVAVTDDINPSVMADFNAHAETIGLPVGEIVLNDAFRGDPSLGDLRRSDHDAFWGQDWPGIMLTDSANFRTPHYHCRWGEDDIDKVDVDFAFKVTQAGVYAVAKQAEPVVGEPSELDLTTDPDAPTLACDVVAQDCDAGEKCVSVQQDGEWIVRCEADRAVTEGELCTRPNGVSGEDDCAKGLFCAFWGLPEADPQQRKCTPYCQNNATCGDGRRCVQVMTEFKLGACAATCDPREAEGCGEGQYCQARGVADRSGNTAICNPGTHGAAAAGETCTGDLDCAATLTCLPSASDRPAVCTNWCANDADCDGATCVASGIPDLGRCAPN